MTPQREGKSDRVFTIELRSRRSIDDLSLDFGKQQGVTFEGTLGVFQSARFVDSMLLEIVGTEGVLRVDLSEGEIQWKGHSPKSESMPRSSP